MAILSAAAGVRFQTKPLSFAAATRFARCLSANRQYADVAVKAAPRSAGKFQVSYSPTSADRAAKLTAAQQASRENRAADQADLYHVHPVGDGSHQVLNLVSGVIYTVRHGRCDCPDFTYRCEGNCLCKHGVMVRDFAQAEQPGGAAWEFSLPPVQARVPAAVAAARAHMAEDFFAD